MPTSEHSESAIASFLRPLQARLPSSAARVTATLAPNTSSATSSARQSNSCCTCTSAADIMNSSA